MAEKAEGILIREEKNRFYLTGFSSSEGMLLVTPKKAVLFLDGRYLELGKQEIKGVELKLLQGDLMSLVSVVKKLGLKRLATEQDKFSAPFLKKLKAETGTHLYPAQNMVEHLRTVKDAGELGNLKKACRLSDRIFEQAKRKIKTGMTEKDMHILLRRIALDLGVLEWSFTSIIGINGHASYPHYMLTDDRKKLKKGDFILIDMGAPWDHYQSDMTRMLFMGSPSHTVGHMYEKVLFVQEKTIRSIQPGLTIGGSIQEFEADMRKEKMFSLMSHALGHGVGLDVHELPYLSRKNKEVWQPGMVFAIEPGVYVQGKYGIRIEDTCHLDSRKAQPLTMTSKKLEDCII